MAKFIDITDLEIDNSEFSYRDIVSRVSYTINIDKIGSIRNDCIKASHGASYYIVFIDGIKFCVDLKDYLKLKEACKN